MVQAMASKFMNGGAYETRSELVGKSHELSLSDVAFTRDAMYTLGLAVKEVASHVGLFPSEITSRMKGRIYWTEGIDILTIIFAVPEIDADMVVEIPKDYWRFRSEPNTAQ